jgi:DNA-binding transcriptional regulator YiaG
MDKGLFQAEVAAIIGVSEQCITNWENGNGEPQIRHLPRIGSFLGTKSIFQSLESTSSRIKLYRQKNGLSYKWFANSIGVDAATISKWESGKNKP